MGWRTVLLPLADEPTPALRAFLGQIVEAAEFYGVDAFLEQSDDHPGQWAFTLEANSSVLNGLIPIISDEVSQIAQDINPTDTALSTMAEQIGRQLTAQLVDHSGESIQAARPGHQFYVRSTGDASPGFQIEELNLHFRRLETGVHEYLDATGSTAWRERHKLKTQIRVDTLAATGSARRLRRTADHLAEAIPSRHLMEALDRFDAAVPHLVALRDMAEHIDEYAVGAGRRDPADAEAGHVFDLDINPKGTVTISARGCSLDSGTALVASRSLAACLQAAVDHYLLYRTMPGFAEFEFTHNDGNTDKAVKPEEEQSHHQEFRRAMAAMALVRPRTEPCPSCGVPM